MFTWNCVGLASEKLRPYSVNGEQGCESEIKRKIAWWRKAEHQPHWMEHLTELTIHEIHLIWTLTTSTTGAGRTHHARRIRRRLPVSVILLLPLLLLLLQLHSCLGWSELAVSGHDNRRHACAKKFVNQVLENFRRTMKLDKGGQRRHLHSMFLQFAMKINLFLLVSLWVDILRSFCHLLTFDLCWVNSEVCHWSRNFVPNSRARYRRAEFGDLIGCFHFNEVSEFRQVFRITGFTVWAFYFKQYFLSTLKAPVGVIFDTKEKFWVPCVKIPSDVISDTNEKVRVTCFKRPGDVISDTKEKVWVKSLKKTGGVI